MEKFNFDVLKNELQNGAYSAKDYVIDLDKVIYELIVNRSTEADFSEDLKCAFMVVDSLKKAFEKASQH